MSCVFCTEWGFGLVLRCGALYGLWDRYKWFGMIFNIGLCDG